MKIRQLRDDGTEQYLSETDERGDRRLHDDLRRAQEQIAMAFVMLDRVMDRVRPR